MLFWVNTFCATYNPRKTPSTIPFITYKYEDDLILDVGPQTSALFDKLLQTAGSVVWNGPAGVFEFDAFAKGTEAISRAIAESDAFSVAGGGDTLAAIDKWNLADKISYVSTGGGAFLEFVEGKILPAVAILEERAKG